MGSLLEVKDYDLEIRGIERDLLIVLIEHFGGHFPLDFSTDFLEKRNSSELRHIVFAIVLVQKDYVEETSVLKEITC